MDTRLKNLLNAAANEIPVKNKHFIKERLFINDK
jgi:hypothetical protein